MHLYSFSFSFCVDIIWILVSILFEYLIKRCCIYNLKYKQAKDCFRFVAVLYKIVHIIIVILCCLTFIYFFSSGRAVYNWGCMPVSLARYCENFIKIERQTPEILQIITSVFLPSPGSLCVAKALYL